MICTKQKSSSPSIYARISERDWSTTGRSGKGFRAGSSMRRSDYVTLMLTYLYNNDKIYDIHHINQEKCNEGYIKEYH